MQKAELKFPAKRQKASAFSLRPSAFACSAFTLIEMLVVLAIMGLLAALAVPALKNFGHSDAMTAADQQLLGDVARARQLAMSQRTTVYMVFVPTNFWVNINPADLTSAQLMAATNLCGDQLAGYTFMADGAIGDQPGQHQWHYLAPWQMLPEGTFIAQQKFNLPGSQPFNIPAYNPNIPIYGFATNAFPVPTPDVPSSSWISMPYIAFNYLGQLTTNGVDMANAHQYIPLARGIMAPAATADTRTYMWYNPGTTMPASPRVSEVPPGNSTNAYNLIDIDPLTGRATLETPKIR